MGPQMMLTPDERAQRTEDVRRWIQTPIASEMFDLVRRKLYFQLQNTSDFEAQQELVHLIRAEGLLSKTIASVYTEEDAYSARKAIEDELDVEQVGDFDKDEVV